MIRILVRILAVTVLMPFHVLAKDLPPIPSKATAWPDMPLSDMGGALPLAQLPHVKGGVFDFRFVTVAQLVDLLYGDALRVPHVIGSDVLQDSRLVSFQYDSKGEDLRAFVKVFLDSLGYKVETRDGVDFVSKKDGANADGLRSFLYRPRFRSAAYLAKLVQPLFTGHVDGGAGASLVPSSGAVGASGVVAPVIAPAASQGSSGGVAGVNDELVISGKASEVANLQRLLPELDTEAGEVVVRGWVYEVSDTSATQSAFSIAAHVLGGQLTLGNGSTDNDSTAIRFSGSWLDAAISALNSDSRFRELSDPHVRVVSGEQVSLNVGSQVPTLGSISYQGASGTAVQSVEYQDAGVIFNVQPTVMGERIEVKLQEQISSFVQTTTGVNNSPTKNTRQMTTTVSLRDGEVVVIGGLVQDSNSSGVNSPGWLPKFLDGHSASKDRTEVLLVLQVQRVRSTAL